MLSWVLGGARRVWRDHIARRALPTYDAACEELGGAPWRPLPEATDRWFLADPKSLAGLVAVVPPAPILDTGAFDLRSHMSSATKLAIAGAIALVAAAVVASLVAGSTSPNSTPTVDRAAAPAAIAPAAIAPATIAPAPAAIAPATIAPAVAAPSPPAAPVAPPRHVAHRRRR